jgi:hypothetical protein
MHQPKIKLKTKITNTTIQECLLVNIGINNEPISYRGALLSTLLHATVYMFLHNLLNLLVQIENKMGLRKKILSSRDSVP